MKTTSSRGISRREFGSIALAGAAALAAGAGCTNTASPSRGRPGWIDAHVHVWTSDVVKYPIDAHFTVSEMDPKSFTPTELFAHCRPEGVERIVLIQMSYYQFDNRYMLDAIAQHPDVFSGIAIVDHHSAGVAQTMKDLAKRGVRGFRLHAWNEKWADWVKDEGMATVWKTARQQNLAVCPLINPADLPYVESMCEKFPETKVVIDHFARVGVTGTIEENELSALCRLARFPHVHLKTSAFYALGKRHPPYDDLIPMIRRVTAAFGAGRLMWASDCPFQVQGIHDYASSIALIRDRISFLSEGDRDAILRDTAERLFFS